MRDLAQSRGDGHRSLVTPERQISEYHEDLIFDFISILTLKPLIDITLNFEARPLRGLDSLCK